MAPRFPSHFKFPKLTLECREGFTGAIHDWLSEGLVDIALLDDPHRAADLDILPLLKEPLLLAGAPDMIASLRKGPVRVKDLGHLPLILPSRSHSFRRLLDRLADQKRFTLQLRNQVDGMRTIKGIVEAGLGYTIFCYAGLYEETGGDACTDAPFSARLCRGHSVSCRRRHGRGRVSGCRGAQHDHFRGPPSWSMAGSGNGTLLVIATHGARSQPHNGSRDSLSGMHSYTHDHDYAALRLVMISSSEFDEVQIGSLGSTYFAAATHDCAPEPCKCRSQEDTPMTLARTKTI